MNKTKYRINNREGTENKGIQRKKRKSSFLAQHLHQCLIAGKGLSYKDSQDPLATMVSQPTLFFPFLSGAVLSQRLRSFNRDGYYFTLPMGGGNQHLVDSWSVVISNSPWGAELASRRIVFNNQQLSSRPTVHTNTFTLHNNYLHTHANEPSLTCTKQMFVHQGLTHMLIELSHTKP